MSDPNILCSLDDLTITGAVGVTSHIDGEEKNLVIVVDQQASHSDQPIVRAYENICPHLRIPLEMMPHEFLDHQDPNYLVCAMHGARFEVSSGSCVAGPCVGQSLTPISIKLEGNTIFRD